jgi:hypothetical protein
MQGKILAHTKSEYSKHSKEKITHRILRTKVWQEKTNFTLKYIFLYIPQRDKALSTFKKKIKNHGTNN